MKTKGEAMDHKNNFAAETVRQVQQALDEVAPYQPTELSKQQTICALAPQILALRSKGYSWTAVAAMLSERAVPVSVAALRTYLRRVREEPVRDAARTAPRRSREGRAVTRPPDPQPALPSASPSVETPSASKPQSSGAAPASTARCRTRIPLRLDASRNRAGPASHPGLDTHDL